MKIIILFVCIAFAGGSLMAQKEKNIYNKYESISTDSSLLKKVQTGNESLNPPWLFSPTNNSYNVPIVPELVFSNVQGADRFDIQLAKDPYFFNIVSSAYREYGNPVNTDTVRFYPSISRIPDFNNNTTYYWRVKASAYNQSEVSPWSQTYKYTTVSSGVSINSPDLLSPAYNSINPWLNLVFNWSGANSANYYQLQWSSNYSFNGYTFVTLSSTSYVSDLSPVSGYYWRVVCFNNNSISYFSSPYRYFETGNEITLTENEYTFDDGSGIYEYKNNLDLFYLIQPPNAANISLSFLSMDTEDGYDIVTVYDGGNINSPVLGEYSGNQIPDNLVSSGGSILIRFTSDNSVTDAGWRVRYVANYQNYDDLSITVEAPYSDLLNNKYIGLFYPDRPIDSDTLSLVINLLGKEHQILKNISLSAALNDVPLSLHLNSGGIKLDANNDGLIDQIPYRESAPVKFVSILATTSEGFKGINENLLLKLNINEIENRIVNIFKEYTISYLTTIHPSENRSFDYFKDAYSFTNPDKVNFKELAYNFFANYPNLLLVLYQWFMSYGGRCYGMAYTSGNYFMKPEQKPYRESYPFSWNPPTLPVMKNITDSHVNQIFASSSWKSIFNTNNPDKEYLKVISSLQSGAPAILCLVKSNDGSDNHAVLVTDLLKVNDECYFQIYDNNFEKNKHQAYYNSKEKFFCYGSYSSFNVDEFSKSRKVKAENEEFINIFMKFLTDSSCKVFATYSKSNFILDRSDGKQIGFQENGLFVNEIENSAVYRLSAGDSSDDSITVIYVPKEYTYNMKIFNYGNTTLKFENHNILNPGELASFWIDSIYLQQNSICYFNEEDQIKTIQVDLNNDGTIDTVVNINHSILTDITFDNKSQSSPANFILYQNYPNPFNPETNFGFQITDYGLVTLRIYNNLGQEVATVIDQVLEPGEYHYSFSISHTPLASGVYYYKLTSGGLTETKKLVIIK